MNHLSVLQREFLMLDADLADDSAIWPVNEFVQNGRKAGIAESHNGVGGI